MLTRRPDRSPGGLRYQVRCKGVRVPCTRCSTAVPIHDWRHMMRRLGKIVVMVMLVAAMATAGYAQTGAMTADQMKMMSGQMKTMSDQMKGGKMTAGQMTMMGEHMQMMADHMKDGHQMAPEHMQMMGDHMKMMNEHMRMGDQ